jgi:hypothetical protein
VRRLAGYSLNVLTALSLVLCLATITLWVRSYRISDGWVYVNSSRTAAVFVLVAQPDTLDIAWDRVPWSDFAMSWSGGVHVVDRSPSESTDISRGLRIGYGLGFSVAGFGFGRGDGHDRLLRWFRLPLSLTSVALALLPIRAVRRRRAARRARVRECARCGYDLRATPERCPECGAVPGGADGSLAR